MKHFIVVTLLALIAIFTVPAQADVNVKVCEDRDSDGRFGVVQYTLRQAALPAAILQSNVGAYNSCLNRKSQLNQCKGNNMCACEDRDRDGRFGVVKHPYKKKSSSVVRANIGNYYDCVAWKNTNPNGRNTAGRYHVCEDRDRDGRYGLVRYVLKEKMGKKKVIAPNHGNYYSCTNHKKNAECL